jgi:hypothetical protein
LTMKFSNVISDQLYKWSDIYETKINSYSTSKEKDPFTKASTFRSYFAWFFNRALQALWQARVASVQMARAMARSITYQ